MIIRELACFATHAEVIEKLQKEEGVGITHQQIQHYNPESAQGSAALAKKWKHIFNTTREKFLEEVSEIPIANRAYRLKLIQQQAERMNRQGNALGVLQAVKEAREEMGEGAEAVEEHNHFYQQINNYNN